MSDGAEAVLRFSRRSQRDLRQRTPEQRQQIVDAIEGLKERPMHGDIKKLAGSPEEWRLRVGEYRVTFALDRQAGEIVILRVLPRGSAYRD